MNGGDGESPVKPSSFAWLTLPVNFVHKTWARLDSWRPRVAKTLTADASVVSCDRNLKG